MNRAMTLAFGDELKKIAMVKVPGSHSVIGTAARLVPNPVLKVALPITMVGVGATVGGNMATAYPGEHRNPRFNPDAFPVLGEDLR